MQDELQFELQLVSATIPELATDKELWIADTGCTAHVTYSKRGLNNTRKGTEHDTFTMGNGAKEKAKLVGDLHCNFDNINVTIANVSYSRRSEIENNEDSQA